MSIRAEDEPGTLTREEYRRAQGRGAYTPHPCPHTGCRRMLGHEGNHQHDAGLQSGGQDEKAFVAYEPSNPWAAISPDCPRGHHARRVYRWTYEPGGPAWYCGECHLLFDEPVPSPGGTRPAPGPVTPAPTPGPGNPQAAA